MIYHTSEAPRACSTSLYWIDHFPVWLELALRYRYCTHSSYSLYTGYTRDRIFTQSVVMLSNKMKTKIHFCYVVRRFVLKWLCLTLSGSLKGPLVAHKACPRQRERGMGSGYWFIMHAAQSKSDPKWRSLELNYFFKNVLKREKWEGGVCVSLPDL